MGLVLAVFAYAAMAVFCWRVIWRFLLRLRSSSEPSADTGSTCGARAMAVVDILFLRRLFLLNKGLWLGEWVFHVCFVLVLLRHLRYVAAPGWVCPAPIQPLGLAAGYVLPFSVIYILVWRFLVEQGRYVSRQNLLLTTGILVASLSGILLHGYFRTDVIQVKRFILSLFELRPVDPPATLSFLAHFVSAVVLLPLVPSHVFAAPLSLLDVRKREETRESLLHG